MVNYRMYADLLLGCFTLAFAIYVWIDYKRKKKQATQLLSFHLQKKRVKRMYKANLANVHQRLIKYNSWEMR